MRRYKPTTLIARKLQRRRLANNMFCPTGEGGGIDPTCGKGEHGMSADDPRNLILKAMKVIEIDADRGALVSARDLRKEVKLPKEVFDKAAMDLVRKGYLSSHYHDFATSLSPEALAELIDIGDPDVHPNQGRYKVGLSKRRDLSEAEPLGKWPTTNVFCPTGPGGGVDPTCSPSGYNDSSLSVKGLLEKQTNKLSDSDKQIVEDYQVSGLYDPLNNYLRTGEFGPTGELKEMADDLFQGGFDEDSKAWALQRIEDMDRVLQDSKLPTELTVYRGIGQGVIQAKVGDVIEDKGFTSTSLNKSIAEEFAESNGTVLQLELPKDYHALYADPVVGLGQEEMILARGSKFRVDKIEKVGGRTVVHASVAKAARAAKQVKSETTATVTKSMFPSKVVEEIFSAASRFGRDKPGKIARSIYRTSRVSLSEEAVREFLAVNASNSQRKVSNPLKSDPTRSATIRRLFLAQIKRKFKSLKRLINQLVVEEDAFGLREEEFNPFRLDSTLNTVTINAGRWRYESDPRKIELFRLWLMRQIEERILGDEKTTTDDWWDAYIEQAYEKGESRSYDDVKKPGKLGGDKQKLDFYNGTKKEFLESSFNRPVHRDKVKILAGRVFTDLKGVTEDMSTKITRSLTDGLIQGLNPRDIAKRMDDAVDIGITRANVIARTEITRAHAEGQLDAMVRLGVTEVGFAVEWSTAGDERVCPLCEPLEGIVLKIEEARGLIPRHPQCRCALLPSGVVDDEELIREKKEIEEAIKDSIMAESPKRSKRTYAEQKERTSWGGASTKISKSRPKFLIEDEEE